MRIFLISILLLTSIYADAGSKLFQLYQDGAYQDACNHGMRTFHPNRKDESFVTLYAFSCLKADYIDRLAVPITVLKNSKEARANATYFSVILMQKKMLFHSLLDKSEIPELRLPTTDHVLSKVFDLYMQDDEKFDHDVHHYKDPSSPERFYRLYVSHKGPVDKMIIEEFYDQMLTDRHILW